jgi:hypothetical protein
VRPIFGYRLSELGPFSTFDDIRPANELCRRLAAAVEGYRRQESVIASNRLLLPRQLKEEANKVVGRLFSSVESNIVLG